MATIREILKLITQCRYKFYLESREVSHSKTPKLFTKCHFTYHKSQRLKIFTAPAVTPACRVRQDRAGLGRHIVQDESENIQGYKPGNCCRNPPEDVVLNEERISCGLEYKVLHEGLRGIFVSLQIIHVRVTFTETLHFSLNYQHRKQFPNTWFHFQLGLECQVIRENKTKN